MWIKPKKWGGYSTQNNLFYLQDKTGFKTYENNPGWTAAYAAWHNPKDSDYHKFVLFGLEILF
jgi:hypothetical protein